MKSKLRLKIIIDILMTLSLLLLMAFIITGDKAHEIIGTIWIVLWIGHTILNRRWYASLSKGRYTLLRIISTVTNILLLISVIGIIYSSIVLSAHVFAFLGIEKGMATARIVHMVSSYWCFVLSSFHLGLHWSQVMIRIKSSHLMVKRGMQTLAAALSAYGVYAFIKQKLVASMFIQTHFVYFDYEQSVLSFYFDYFCMMILFTALSYYTSLFIKKRYKMNDSGGQHDF